MNPPSSDVAVNIPPPPEGVPSNELIEGSRKVYVELGIPLYEASIQGNWKKAKPILEARRDLVRSSINQNHETPLHIAASAKNTKEAKAFVENLLVMMKKEDLELRNKSQNTALFLAASAGNVEIAELMVTENRALLDIRGSVGMPLYAAALFAHHAMVKYLYDNSQKMKGDYWNAQDRGWVLLKCVEAKFFDVALRIVADCPDILFGIEDGLQEFKRKKGLCHDIFLALARMTDAFSPTKPHAIRRIVGTVCHLKLKPHEKDGDAMELLKLIWDKISDFPTKDIDDIMRGPLENGKDIVPKGLEFETQALSFLENISKNIEQSGVKVTKPTKEEEEKKKKEEAEKNKYSSRVLFVATEMGNTRFIIEFIRRYPDIIWKVNDNMQSIFHVAVIHRHEGIYNLLHEIGSTKDFITPLKDKNNNNMLHLVGKSAKKKRLQDVSGVALQMQRELLWFKEVESMIPPSYRERKNDEGLTPQELFTKEHKDLVTRGEQWMKDTAAQCMLVATLIATIVFAAAFTVPGGYNQIDGFPVFIRKVTFIVFVISDAISLFLSSSSILLFLSILTSRYAERDFLESLPKKLMIGLVFLFLSISTMVVAFSVSFFVLYHSKMIWIPIIIGLFAAIPVILFIRLQYSLLKDVIHSTYFSSKFLFNPKKPVLYY